jgi:hypothetical protein
MQAAIRCKLRGISLMALVQGIHILAHGSKREARGIAADIVQHQRLLIGPGAWSGAGAYAWYADRLPAYLRTEPQVVFEIDDTAIIPVTTPKGLALGYFRIPGAIGDYVSIRPIAFLNVWE